MKEKERVEIGSLGIWIFSDGNPIRFIGKRELQNIIKKIEELRGSASPKVRK